MLIVKFPPVFYFSGIDFCMLCCYSINTLQGIPRRVLLTRRTATASKVRNANATDSSEGECRGERPMQDRRRRRRRLSRQVRGLKRSRDEGDGQHHR